MRGFAKTQKGSVHLGVICLGNIYAAFRLPRRRTSGPGNKLVASGSDGSRAAPRAWLVIGRFAVGAPGPAPPRTQPIRAQLYHGSFYEIRNRFEICNEGQKPHGRAFPLRVARFGRSEKRSVSPPMFIPTSYTSLATSNQTA
jgi:hypothetical protein